METNENFSGGKMPDEHDHHYPSHNRAIVGVVLVLVGLFLVLRNTGFFPGFIDHIIFSWPMLLVAIGLIMTLGSSEKTAGIIVMAVGGFFLLPKIFSETFYNYNMFWPSIFIIIGVIFIVSRRKTGGPAFSKGVAGDDYIDYVYVNQLQIPINLYVGYYTSVGVTGAYHSPKNCLPGSGWGLDTVKEVTLPVGIEGKKKSTVTEMLIRNGDDYQVVLYWYQNRGRIIASEYWEKVYLVLDALIKHRRDGTFVRIMDTVKDKNIQAAEQRAQKFAETVMVRLQDFIPGSHL